MPSRWKAPSGGKPLHVEMPFSALALVQDIGNEVPTEAADPSDGKTSVMDGKDLAVVNKPEVLIDVENGGWIQVQTRSKAQTKLDQNKGGSHPSSVPHG
ncbi:hypothetical protein RIF29_29578 [Crotalaria pallida]|uniref:Uncharacterized protein n=1 Tax=Crotalaria pallida TaxID=3830 RepID=A0AAN9ELL7_CROPI